MQRYGPVGAQATLHNVASDVAAHCDYCRWNVLTLQGWRELRGVSE